MQEGESLYQHPDQQRNSNTNENQNENGNPRVQSRPESAYVPEMREPYQSYAPDKNEPGYEQNERYQEYESGYNNNYEIPSADPQWSYRPEGEKLRPRSPQRSRSNKPWLLLLGGILLIGILLFSGASKFWYSRFSPDYVSIGKNDHGYPQPVSVSDLKVTDHAQIVINVIDTNVHIQAGIANLISLRGGQGSDGKDGIPGVKTTKDGNQVSIDSNPLNGDTTNLDVSVPADSSLVIHTLSGNADVNGVNGSIVFDSQSGDFTVNGNSNDQGQISAHAVSGNIDLTNVRLGGQSDLNDGSGHVIMHGTLVSGNAHIETTSGDVSIELLQGNNINVHAETATGNVVSDYGNSNSGGNSSSPNLDIHTLSGNISVTKG